MEDPPSSMPSSGESLHEIHVCFDPCSWTTEVQRNPSAPLELEIPKASESLSNQTTFNTLQRFPNQMELDPGTPPQGASGRGGSSGMDGQDGRGVDRK